MLLFLFQTKHDQAGTWDFTLSSKMYFLFKKIHYGLNPKSLEFHQKVRNILKGIKEDGLEN